MAEIYLQKYNDGFRFLPEDSERLPKIKTGEIVSCEIKRPRNPRHHRKFFALLNLVYESQDKYKNLNDLLVEFKLKSGWYDEHITMKGQVVYIPRSVKFSSMDQDTFNEFYSRAIDIALRDFLPDSSELEINAHVDRVIGFV